MKNIIVLFIIFLSTTWESNAQSSFNFERMADFMKQANNRSDRYKPLTSFEISSHPQETFEILLRNNTSFKISLMGSDRHKNPISLNLYKKDTLMHKRFIN